MITRRRAEDLYQSILVAAIILLSVVLNYSR